MRSQVGDRGLTVSDLVVGCANALKQRLQGIVSLAAVARRAGWTVRLVCMAVQRGGMRSGGCGL